MPYEYYFLGGIIYGLKEDKDMDKEKILQGLRNNRDNAKDVRLKRYLTTQINRIEQGKTVNYNHLEHYAR